MMIIKINLALGVNRWLGFAKRVIEVGRPQKFGRVIKHRALYLVLSNEAIRHFDTGHTCVEG